MNTIVLAKSEYASLREKAEAFDRIVGQVNPSIFFTPSERSRKKIMAEFSKTKIYDKKFLKSLDKGLKRSSLFTD